MKKYQVIYADPPWKYDFSRSKSRSIERHYPSMEQKDICALKIPTAENSILFLWATNPKLVEAFEVIKAWGFTYKTGFVWDKILIGMGYYVRNRHELILVATKGEMPIPVDIINGLCIRVKRKKHSQKPAVVRALIEKWYPTETKIELFAREHFEGWDVFGDEVPSTFQKRLLVIKNE